MSTEEERETLQSELSAGSDWLDEDEDSERTQKVYIDKLKSLQEAADKIFFRIKESKERPKAEDSCRTTFEMTRVLVANITEKMEVTEDEKDSLLKKVNETGSLQSLLGILPNSITDIVVHRSLESWLDDVVAQQAAKPLTEDPVVKSSEMSSKCSEIQFRTRMLLKRPYKRPPKVEKKPKKPVKTEEEAKTTEEENVPSEETTPATEDSPNVPETVIEETTTAPEEEQQKTEDATKDEL
jgi:heat shock protein 4